MTALKRPSSIHEIRLEPVGTWHLFKFSETLQLRMESLLNREKADQLTLEEIAELDAISELDRIPIHMNAMLAAQYAISDETKRAIRERAKSLCEYRHSSERLSASRFTIDHIRHRSVTLRLSFSV